MDQIIKYLQKNFTDNELTKVKQTVIPEVYMMLESYMEATKLFASEKNSEIFFSVFLKLIFFPAVNFKDQFKIFLEERYITIVFKKLPETLNRNPPSFKEHFLRFICKILDVKIENSMINVILCNLTHKFADVFHGCKSAGVKFPKNQIIPIFHSLLRSSALASDESYVSMVKSSKNFKEMLWISSVNCLFALVDTLFNEDSIESAEAIKLLVEFATQARSLRETPAPTYHLMKGDMLKEFCLYTLQYPKILQSMVIFCSQMKDRPDEAFLMESVEDIKAFEVFLDKDPFKYFHDDLECRNLTTRYIKNLIEAYNRILAAICSDHKKSAEAYKELILKYSRTFEEFIKLPHKVQTKIEE
jgi:hypothetical protein